MPHTDYITGAGLAQEFSSSRSFTQASLLIQRRHGESSVRHREQQIIVRYVRHRERISNSSSSESKNRSNLSESEKSAKENFKENFKLMFINSRNSVLFIFRGDSHIFLAVMHFLVW